MNTYPIFSVRECFSLPVESLGDAAGDYYFVVSFGLFTRYCLLFKLETDAFCLNLDVGDLGGGDTLNFVCS